MAELNRRRHQFRCLANGKAEHEALVSRTLFVGFFAVGVFGIDSRRNVARLPAESLYHETGVSLEKRFLVDVADLANRGANLLDIVELRIGGNLASDDDEITLGQRFAGDPALMILGQTCVQDAIRNGVADFVRMTFSHGFRGKDISVRHSLEYYD